MSVNNWDADFESFRSHHLNKSISDSEYLKLSEKWLEASSDKKYSYQFDWLGIPIIQMPSDIVIFQEIVWKTRPDLIIETGVARGGSINFWASIQSLCQIDGKVIGVDIDIRDHAKLAIADSQFSNRIQLIQGDSTESNVIRQIKEISKKFSRIMIVLDSNHTHDHVLKELELLAELVTPGCYLLVLDTMIEDLPIPSDRPWHPGNSPKSAVQEFLKSNPGLFLVDEQLENRSLHTVAPSGFLLKT